MAGSLSPQGVKNATLSTSPLLYAVDEAPPEWMSVFLGVQMVVLVLAPIAVTPIVVARMAGIDPGEYGWIIFASLLASGIGTMIQVRRFGVVGSGYFLVIGSSGSFIACGLAAAQMGGMALVATMAVLSAPLQLFFAWFLGPMRRIITPLVGGVVIMLIVVSVLGISLDMMANTSSSAPSLYSFWVSAATLAVIMGLAVFGNRHLRLWSLVIGLLVGTLVAAGLGLTDFSTVGQSPWLGLPKGQWQGFALDFRPEWIGLYLAFVMVTIVGSVETLGDGMAIQRISERNFRKVDYERVQGAMYADGVANAVAGALGTLPNTTYSNAIAAVQLTGVASRRVGLYVAIFLGLLAFSPKISALITAIPSPVVGAFLFILLAMLFVTGIQLAASEGLNYESGVIIGVSFWMGYVFQNRLFFADLMPVWLEPFLNNGIAAGGLFAIVLSLLFQMKPAGRARRVFSRQTAAMTDLQDFINEYAAVRRIPVQALQRLHLTAEELFMHLCGSQAFKGPELQVLLHFSDGRIHVEFVEVSDLKDLDFMVEEAGERVHSLDPDLLGLRILDRFASGLRHLRIGGVNYISYHLAVD
ncbi:uracil-xanthine permease family protein [Desulfobotulus mexicanus]|uniref:Xanthine/uracil/vitamin C permease n=1 Tax=Desulfobotulus mexicanus TaxID=2586642 RepID=A0A5Q4VCQ2_9BACT|nr:solute carrier family 23 protein [Desulfobotulus mexicanus]TYT75484.1 xanthine/uracil/vitamin C permease [Desulfobotulus mexicanus]